MHGVCTFLRVCVCACVRACARTHVLVANLFTRLLFFVLFCFCSSPDIWEKAPVITAVYKLLLGSTMNVPLDVSNQPNTCTDLFFAFITEARRWNTERGFVLF